MSVSYFPGNRSESDSSVSTGPTLYFRKQPSIESSFPPYKSESETDGSTISESNKTTLAAAQLWSNSIDSIFSPANSNKSDTDDGSSVSNEPTPDFSKQLSIQFFFPPYMSESGTNENYETQSSYSLMSLFPPARSLTDSSQIYDITPPDTSKATTMDSVGYILEIYFSSQQSVPILDLNYEISRSHIILDIILEWVSFISVVLLLLQQLLSEMERAIAFCEMPQFLLRQVSYKPLRYLRWLKECMLKRAIAISSTTQK